MISDPILSTLEKLVSLHDGVAETVDAHTLDVLLAENIAEALDISESTTFSTRADVPNSFFVTYHSELLKKFEGLLQERGYVAAIGVKFDGYLKKTGFDKLVSERLTPLNGLIRVLEAKPEMTRYIWCHVAYEAEADEKRLGMVSFFINELTGVTPVEIGDALLWESDRIPVDKTTTAISMPPEQLSSLIEKMSPKLIQAQLENWFARLNRQRRRDEERLKAYYGTIGSEIKAKIVHKGLTGELEEKELERIEATNRELERKVKDVAERYAAKVSAELYSALAIALPTVHIICELVRKRNKRTVTAVWNPFTKILEPLRCEQSGEPVFEFYLDDKEGKIISPNCWVPK